MVVTKKKYIRMKNFILLCILSVSCLYAAAIDRNEAIRIADNFMFSNRQNILSGSLHPEAWFGCLLMQSASVCPSNSEYMDE